VTAASRPDARFRVEFDDARRDTPPLLKGEAALNKVAT